jgi:Protein of unknown function (DUF736)
MIIGTIRSIDKGYEGSLNTLTVHRPNTIEPNRNGRDKAPNFRYSTRSVSSTASRSTESPRAKQRGQAAATESPVIGTSCDRQGQVGTAGGKKKSERGLKRRS